MDFSEAMEYISCKDRFGEKPGLARMDAVARASGLYARIAGIKFIHIAGTNGKGSAAALAASALRAAGKRTGLYVSPFVEHFTERISVDGECISEADFARQIEYFKPYADALDKEKLGSMKQFELITLAALGYFAEKKCECAAFEVGIGGRLDATNIILPAVSIIMSISEDHKKQLGDTVEKIAAEKCGIIKEGVPTVVYPRQEKGVAEVIRAAAEKKRSPLYFAREPENVETGLDGTRFTFDGESYFVNLSGDFQAFNAATVLTALRFFPEVTDEAAKKGFSRIRHPGRLDAVSQSPTVVTDGAHNAGAIRELRRNVKELFRGKKTALVFGMCRDHADEKSLSAAFSKDDTVFVSAVNDVPRAVPPDELARLIAPYCGRAVPCKDLASALAAAKEYVGPDGAVICFGSLYVSGEINNLSKNAL